MIWQVYSVFSTHWVTKYHFSEHFNLYIWPLAYFFMAFWMSWIRNFYILKNQEKLFSEDPYGCRLAGDHQESLLLPRAGTRCHERMEWCPPCAATGDRYAHPCRLWYREWQPCETALIHHYWRDLGYAESRRVLQRLAEATAASSTWDSLQTLADPESRPNCAAPTQQWRQPPGLLSRSFSGQS